MPPTLHAVVLETRNYVVGAANAASGFYRRDAADTWAHAGWQNVRCFGLAIDPRESRRSQTVFLACGNGVLRSCDGGASWRVTTDWRVTEVLDVALDPFSPGSVYAATAYGPWHSADGGETWQPLAAPGPRPDATFSTAIVPDAEQPGRLLIGTEDGLFVSMHSGQHWTAIGPRRPIRAFVQSPHRPEVWLAGTEDHGLLYSDDGGSNWTTVCDGATVYAVAFDPTEPQRAAAVGFGTDLLVSEDGGVTWATRSLELPGSALHALAFDPDVPGRLWLGTVGAGVYTTEDLGATCAFAGLAEATLYDLVFLPA
jgi:photosystem II stability/assembly factor-like uncharacterized protein